MVRHQLLFGGNHTATTSGGPQFCTLDPDFDFFNDESCTVTVFATEVSDVDVDDPPDNMAADEVFTFAPLVDSPIVINEVDADTAGSDALEFVELYDGGVGNALLDGLVVVFYNGNGDTSIRRSIWTDSRPMPTATSIWAMRQSCRHPRLSSLATACRMVPMRWRSTQATQWISRMVRRSLAAASSMHWFTTLTTGTTAVLLSVLTPGQPQQNEDGNDDKDFRSNARVPNGGTQLVIQLLSAGADPGASNVVHAEIFEIQEPGLDSLADTYVQTNGNVVTALDTNGFFMQTPVARSDGDAFTSDGIFRFHGQRTVRVPSA